MALRGKHSSRLTGTTCLPGERLTKLEFSSQVEDCTANPRMVNSPKSSNNNEAKDNQKALSFGAPSLHRGKNATVRGAVELRMSNHQEGHSATQCFTRCWECRKEERDGFLSPEDQHVLPLPSLARSLEMESLMSYRMPSYVPGAAPRPPLEL